MLCRSARGFRDGDRFGLWRGGRALRWRRRMFACDRSDRWMSCRSGFLFSWCILLEVNRGVDGVRSLMTGTRRSFPARRGRAEQRTTARRPSAAELAGALQAIALGRLDVDAESGDEAE